MEGDGVKDDEGCFIMSQCADIRDGPILILADNLSDKWLDYIRTIYLDKIV